MEGIAKGIILGILYLALGIVVLVPLLWILVACTALIRQVADNAFRGNKDALKPIALAAMILSGVILTLCLIIGVIVLLAYLLTSGQLWSAALVCIISAIVVVVSFLILLSKIDQLNRP